MADQHDPDISRKYRELGAEEPPRALDEAILAASRRAVESHPAPLIVPAGRRRWYFPLAAAAVITLAVAVTVHVERQKLDDELVVATAPSQGQKEERAAPQVEKKDLAFSGPAAEQPKPAQERMREPQPFTPEPPPAASPAHAMRDLAKSNEAATAVQGVRPSEAPAQARARSDAAETRRMESELQVQREAQLVQGAVPQATLPPPASPQRDITVGIRGYGGVEAHGAPAPAPQAKPMPDLGAAGAIASIVRVSPERWLEQIAQLRKQGKHEEADKALAEFRKQYPDYRLTDEMRAKVERK